MFKWNYLTFKNGLHPKLKRNCWVYFKIITMSIVFSSFISLSSYGVFVSFKSGDKIDTISQACISIAGMQVLLTILSFMNKTSYIVFLFDSINEFFLKIDEKDEKIQKFCDSFVKYTIIIENVCLVTSVMTGGIFPATYIFKTLKNVFSDLPPQKFLIFALHLPMYDDLKYEWPLNEIVNVFVAMVAFSGFTVFLGWNGMMGTFFMFITCHLKIACYEIENLFVECNDDIVLIKKRLAKIIEHHQDTLR